MMDRKYFGDVYYFNCPDCGRQAMGVLYVGAYDQGEVVAIKNSGQFEYPCDKCGSNFPSNRVAINGELNEVPKTEALSHGLAYTLKRSGRQQ